MEFRLDDPTVEDHKFTNDDDSCAFNVDGWELIWWLGETSYSMTGDDGITVNTALEVHFSRADLKIAICPVDTSMSHLPGTPAGMIDDVANDGGESMWAHLTGKC